MNILLEPFDSGKNLYDWVKLSALSFPEIKHPKTLLEQRYHWKFSRFPHAHHGKKSYEYAAFENGELIGYYAALPFRYSINGVVHTCGMVCDVMIHPQKRKRGIFSRLGEYATQELKKAGLSFTTAYPIRKQVMPGFLNAGWKIGFELPMFATPLSAKHFLSQKGLSLFSGPVNLVLNPYNWALALTWKKLKPFYDVEFLDLTDISLKVARNIIAEWEKDKNFFLIKDADFLAWRLSAPCTTYKIALLRDKARAVGIAILRVKDFYSIPAMEVIDYVILHEYLDASPRFLSELKRFASQQGCEAVTMMLSALDANLYKISKAGFLRSPYLFRFISKKLIYQMEENSFLNERNWHTSWIDSDRL